MELMEVNQQRQAQSFYGGTRQIQLHEMHIHDNQMRIQRNKDRASPYGSYYEPSRRRERKPHNKSQWNEDESKRKRRVAKYQIYETDGKVKSSLKEGFRSFKITCKKIIANF